LTAAGLFALIHLLLPALPWDHPQAWARLTTASRARPRRLPINFGGRYYVRNDRIAADQAAPLSPGAS
jgi:hypothetical protein